MRHARPLWRRPYEGWLLIAAKFGEVQTLIIVALVYVLVIGPMSIVMKVGRADPLHKRNLRSDGSAWFDADSTAAPELERAKRLF